MSRGIIGRTPTSVDFKIHNRMDEDNIKLSKRNFIYMVSTICHVIPGLALFAVFSRQGSVYDDFKY